MKRKFLVLLGIITITGVSSSAIIISDISRKQDTYQSDLKNAPEQITINNHNLKLECYIWRDFMPCIGDGCGNHEAICLVKIIDINSTTFPEDIDAIQFWAINKLDIWHVNSNDPAFSNHQYIRTENELSFVVRNGPNTNNWAEGTLVDIIVQLEYNSQLYLLKASDQPIIFTH